MNSRFRVDRDKNLTHVMCTDALKIPRYRGFSAQQVPAALGEVGNEPGMEGDVILDRNTGRFCWHDGTTWQCVFGGSSSCDNDQSLVYSMQITGQNNTNFLLNIPTRSGVVNNADDSGNGRHTVVAYGPAFGPPQTLFTAPNSVAPDLGRAPALAVPSTGSTTGNSLPLGVQNIGANTLYVMVHVVISYSNSGTIVTDTEHLFWNFASAPGPAGNVYTTFGNSAINVPYGDSAYNEYLIDTYTPDQGNGVSNVIAMEGLVLLSPGQSIAVSAATGSTGGGNTLYEIHSAKLRAEVYQRL